MPKYKVELSTVSYIDIEAEDHDAADEVVHKLLESGAKLEDYGHDLFEWTVLESQED